MLFRSIESNRNLTFLSIQDQQDLTFSLPQKLPFNHYTRKNVGYLYSILQGAEFIYDTDDDNFPYPDWGFDKFCCHSQAQSISKYVNAYQHFTDENIWPRGFPLEFIAHKKNELTVATSKEVEIGVWQGLADLDPDVDAIYRLVHGAKQIRFDKNIPIYLGKGSYCPFNSQNTLWNKKAFPLLYLQIGRAHV